MTFLIPRVTHASVCSYEAYEYRTPRHDNVIIGLSAIDDISAAVVFCASSTTDDAHVCQWKSPLSVVELVQKTSATENHLSRSTLQSHHPAQ